MNRLDTKTTKRITTETTNIEQNKAAPNEGPSQDEQTALHYQQILLDRRDKWEKNNTLEKTQRAHGTNQRKDRIH